LILSLVPDERRIPPAGRIAEVEDIIGSVFVTEGKVVKDSYEPQPMYLVCTQDGVMQLPEGIDEYVLDVLQKVSNEEKVGKPT